MGAKAVGFSVGLSAKSSPAALPERKLLIEFRNVRYSQSDAYQILEVVERSKTDSWNDCKPRFKSVL